MKRIEIIPTYQLVKCINTKVLSKSGNKPKLNESDTYHVNNYCECGCGETHYDVGIKSPFNFVKCYKCDVELPNSDMIQWCNSSRFVAA